MLAIKGVHAAKGPQKGLLNKVFSIIGISGNRSGHPKEDFDFGHHEGIKPSVGLGSAHTRTRFRWLSHSYLD